MPSQTKFVGLGQQTCCGFVWINPNNITALDSNAATCNIGAGGTSQPLQGLMSGSAFALPGDAVIDGIAVTFFRDSFTFFGGNVTDNNIQLLVAGVAAGSNHASGTPWSTTSQRSDTVGGSTDLWGLVLGVADVNDPNFGAVMDCFSALGATAVVNAYEITVYYHEPATADLTATTSPSDDFGNVTVGDTATGITIEIVNNSESDIVISSLTVNGDFAATGPLPATPFTLHAFNADGPVNIPMEFTPSIEGFIDQPDALAIVHNGANTPLDVNLQGTGTALTSAYPVRGTPLVPIAGVVGSAIFARFDPTDLNCETDASFTRWYDWGLMLTEKTFMRGWFRLLDLGAVIFSALLRFPSRPNIVSSPVTAGSGTGMVINAAIDFIGSDDLVEVTITREANDGPMMINSMLHKVEEMGDYIEKT